MERYFTEPPEDSYRNGVLKQTLLMYYRSFFDKVVPYLVLRWLVFAFVLVVYIVRVVKLEGFFVVSYALGIFLLSQFLGFLTPQIQPSVNDDADPLLPTNTDGEFRPFMRKVSEWKFWMNCSTSILIGIVCTFLPFLDLPVFWPVLLLYFLTLVYVTLRRQIAHMIRYKYVPFTYGKPRPQAKTGTGATRSI